MNKVGDKIDINALMVGRRFDTQTTINQLYAGGRQKVWSWGFNNPVGFADKVSDIYALRFTVTGLLFRGHIYIVLNGIDLYNIYYCSNRGNIKMVNNDIYCEDLTDVIDRKIECK